MRSIWIAGLLAPLAAPVAFFLGISAMSVAKDGFAIGMLDWEAGVAVSVAFVLPMSYLAMWIFGMPYIYWLRLRWRFSVLNVCLGALILCTLGIWVLQALGGSKPLDLTGMIYGPLITVPLGLSVALVFCGFVGMPLRST